MRRGRVVDRIELVTERVAARRDCERWMPAIATTPRSARDRAAAVLRRAAGAARSPHAGRARRRRSSDALEGVAVGTRRAGACGSSSPQRGEKRGLLDLAARNAAHGVSVALRRRRHVGVRGARHAARRAGAAGAAAPHRVLRHLDVAGPRNGRVDGGRGRGPDATKSEYRKFRIRGRRIGPRVGRATPATS